MSVLIGIDLGTTNSLGAVFREGRPELIPNALGDWLTPSVVGLTEDETILVGRAARELQVVQPQRCAWAFKRAMGMDRSFQLGPRSFSAPELSSMVLRSIRDDAAAFLGEPIDEAVITVPAYFNDLQRRATQLAGELAGLNVRRIVNEPTAAALTYGFHDRMSEKRLLVFDLGGGTFDVTVMEVFEGVLEIQATAGASQLGGEDFTDRLAAWSLRKRDELAEQVEFAKPLRWARLRAESEAAKRALTDSEHTELRIPDDKGLLEGQPTVAISRDDFRELCKDLVARLKLPLSRALRDAECSLAELDDIILVGGATRMPVVREMIERDAHRAPLCVHDPDHVVALGAAVQAALMLDDRSVSDMVMTDVCPHTLGMEIVKEFGELERDGYYLPVIHRNTTIPTSCERVVRTARPHQTEVLVRVFQGESRRVADNLELGTLSVSGIPPTPEQAAIHIRFTYDLSGVLEVEAYIPSTGRKVSTVIVSEEGALSEEALTGAVKRMQALKFYPRDEQRNQDLVLYCERVVVELNASARKVLEEALDGFEMSMSSGDRGEFESCREQLLMVLSSVGFHYESQDDA